MRRRKNYNEREYKAYVNLAPLVDISLSLVVMFILSIPFVLESGIFVSRAGVSTNKKISQYLPKEKNVTTNIYIKSNGKIFLNNKPITFNELRKILPELIIRSVSKNVVISADSEVRYEDVIRVIDLSKISGAEDVLLLKRR